MIVENKKLCEGIAQLREEKTKVTDMNRTYATGASNSNVLIVNPTEKPTGGRLNDTSEKIKDNLRNKVNPAKIGISITVSKKTKNGGIIVKFENSKDINVVQTEIQESIGEKYQVIKKDLNKYPLKIINKRYK